ncbi:MAG: hypothetical protein NVSMB62_27830 [Acidobacteriaceae bacterium]
MGTEVLIYGKDPTLINIRAMVLEHVGLESVCRLIDSADAPELVRTELAVLCSSIVNKDQEKVAATIKGRWPDTSVLLIRLSADRLHQDPSGFYVCGINPEKIVSSCQKILQLAA